MPTQTELTPQTTTNRGAVTHTLQAIASAQSHGSANTTFSTAFVPVPRRYRFAWLRSFIHDPLAIPALYGLIVPLAALHCTADGTPTAAGDFLLFNLPVYMAFVLGLTRKKKRSGMLTGALLGGTNYAALVVVDSIRRGICPDAAWFIFVSVFFAIIGAAIGMVATSLRQGALWLFGSNRP